MSKNPLVFDNDSIAAGSPNIKGTLGRNFGRNGSVISGSHGAGLPPIDDGSFANKNSLGTLDYENYNKRPVYIDYLKELRETRPENYNDNANEKIIN